jgi:hypothetical protein
MQKDYVLWGARDGVPPIKLTGGTLGRCRSQQKARTAEGWRCAIYAKGTAPTGLRMTEEGT